MSDFEWEDGLSVARGFMFAVALGAGLWLLIFAVSVMVS